MSVQYLQYLVSAVFICAVFTLIFLFSQWHFKCKLNDKILYGATGCHMQLTENQAMVIKYQTWKVCLAFSQVVSSSGRPALWSCRSCVKRRGVCIGWLRLSWTLLSVFVDLRPGARLFKTCTHDFRCRTSWSRDAGYGTKIGCGWWVAADVCGVWRSAAVWVVWSSSWLLGIFPPAAPTASITRSGRSWWTAVCFGRVFSWLGPWYALGSPLWSTGKVLGQTGSDAAALRRSCRMHLTAACQSEELKESRHDGYNTL